VTALIKSVLERDMPNAHFIILDTNNEYEQAFTQPVEEGSGPGEPLFDRLVLRNEGDTPQGLFVPHWLMNSLDYNAFFRPAEGAQAPLLFKAISAARAQFRTKSALLDSLGIIEDTSNQIQGSVASPATGSAAYWGKKNLRDQIDALTGVLASRQTRIGVSFSEVYSAAFTAMRRAVETDGPLDANVNDTVRTQLQSVRQQLAADRDALRADDEIPVGVDSPVHFDFDDFVGRVFQEELEREAQRDPRLRSYVGTLQLRLEQARHDPRYAFLFRVKPFGNALASFIRLLLGLEPAKHFATSPPPWATAYTTQYATPKRSHQITILDLSELASEVLENVTALIGRLVLDFMQRIPERASLPVVLVLEEAHRYIPERATLERQLRAREVFEKIAKEGRKFGLSLLVASQRPSELSRTVLAQCNSFIVHRIQNPDDQQYFRSVISGINRELLDQLPALAQQQAIVMGDCVTLPLQVRIRTVSPRPRSLDPEFVSRWSDSRPRLPDVEQIAAKWEGRKPGPEN
jgi:hypothetical protein